MSLFTIIICIVLFFALIETPMFTVIAGLSIACLFFIDFDIISLQMILIEMNRLASMPILVALPLFTFVGCLLSETKSPTRIMNFMQSIIGWLPGGLAIAGLLACDFFTALTGASGVTVVALGGVLYPILIKQNYDEKFTLGLIATSGSIGLLLPPSLPIILYGIVAQVNIAKIFIAALLPGFLLVLVISLYAFLKHLTGLNHLHAVMMFKWAFWFMTGRAVKLFSQDNGFFKVGICISGVGWPHDNNYRNIKSNSIMPGAGVVCHKELTPLNHVF